MGHRTTDKLDVMFIVLVLCLRMSLLLIALSSRLVTLISMRTHTHFIKGAPAGVSFKNLSLQPSTLPTSHFASSCSQFFGCLKQLLYFQGFCVFFGKHFFSGRGFITLYFGPVRKADPFGTSSQIPRMPPLGH